MAYVASYFGTTSCKDGSACAWIALLIGQHRQHHAGQAIYVRVRQEQQCCAQCLISIFSFAHMHT